MNKFVTMVTLMGWWLGISIVSPGYAEVKNPNAFLPGERLEFNVYFEFVLGGHASMEVSGLEEINGHPCYHIISKARSTQTVDMFYKVRDQVESWRDSVGNFSRRFSKSLREGKHKYDRQVNYYPERSQAIAFDRKREFKPDTLQLLQPVQDILSAFYEARTHKLEVGQIDKIFIEDDGKQYELFVRVLRREVVEVPAGTFSCLVVEPTLETSGLFRAEGTMEIWLTDDEYQMPVLMKSKLYFGRVWAKLMKYRRGE